MVYRRSIRIGLPLFLRLRPAQRDDPLYRLPTPVLPAGLSRPRLIRFDPGSRSVSRLFRHPGLGPGLLRHAWIARPSRHSYCGPRSLRGARSGHANPVRRAPGGTHEPLAPNGQKLRRLCRHRQGLVRESESTAKSGGNSVKCGERIGPAPQVSEIPGRFKSDIWGHPVARLSCGVARGQKKRGPEGQTGRES